MASPSPPPPSQRSNLLEPASPSPREDSPSWMPPSAQPPRRQSPNIVYNANVSPPRMSLKRKNATPDFPEDSHSPNKKPKSDPDGTLGRRTRVYNGYKITVSPTQKRPRPAPRPLKLPPIRSMEQVFSSSNMPNPNVAPVTRAAVRLQKNGVALPQTTLFDPWNLNSAGHQKRDWGRNPSDDRGWRAEREAKLNAQFGSKKSGAIKGQMSIADCWKKPEASVASSDPTPCLETRVFHKVQKPPPKTSILNDLVFYINGSTMPYISDHRLRHIIAENGGSTTISLAKRTVTHVILTPKLSISSSSSPTKGVRDFHAAGGGLAATKIQQQISNMRGPSRNIQFVSPTWIVESIKAGKRLPEIHFAEWKMVSEKQESVVDRFFVQSKPSSSDTPPKTKKPRFFVD
jgi:BRCT domain, a BRCA1 C-terminus domain